MQQKSYCGISIYTWEHIHKLLKSDKRLEAIDIWLYYAHMHTERCLCIHPTFCHMHDVTKDPFLSRVQLIWIQDLPSPRPVAMPNLKKSLYPTYKWGKNGWIHAFLKSISKKWNASNVFSDLNLDNQVYFLQQMLPKRCACVLSHKLSNICTRLETMNI